MPFNIDFSWFYQAFPDMQIYFTRFWKIAQYISQGLGSTLLLFAFTILFSIPLGLFIALGAISKRKIMHGPIKFYIWVLRGTPLMLQLMFVYYVLPRFTGVRMDSFNACTLAFVLNYAAYFAEIFRAGIQSIEHGQFEAARALGFSNGQTMLHIIIPQTLSRVIPPIGNETITLVKDTSLASILAISEIMMRTRLKVASEANISAYLVPAVYYLLMTFVLTRIFTYLEKRTSASQLQ